MTVFRPTPESQVMTPETFAEGAFETPLGALSTFGSSVVAGVNESYGLGTAIRELSTPGLAEAPARAQRGAGFRYLTPEEVQSQGDKLYETQDQYKASPYYRQSVPFEKGMTEARAKALAGSIDLQTVRDYYGQKRPVTAFLGGLAGQMADPLNYIPVVGEYAAPAALGRVAGRAFVGSLDAAANTALFGAALWPERARLGFDTSWSTLAQDTAFAALGGAVIGGSIGALTRTHSRPSVFPETQANRTKAAIVLNDAIDGLVHDEEVKLGPTAQGLVDEAQASILAFHGSPFEFDKFSLEKVGAGEGAQSFGHGLYFAEEPVVAKQYAEEISRSYSFPSSSILSRGLPAPDVKLAGSAGSLYEVKIAAKADQFLDHDRPLSQQTPEVKDALAKAADNLPKGRSFEAKAIPDIFRGKSTDVPGGALSKMLADVLGGEDKAAQFFRENGVPGIKYLDANSRTMGEGSRNYVVFDDQLVHIISRNGKPLDYSVPSPKATIPTDNVKAAEKRVESIQKMDHVEAQIKAVKDAGIDIETGKHDLENDIAQLRERGLLSEADEAELKAVDETYAAASAWGDVMEAARMCVKK